MLIGPEASDIGDQPVRPAANLAWHERATAASEIDNADDPSGAS
jgi:hypothetical protein